MALFVAQKVRAEANRFRRRVRLHSEPIIAEQQYRHFHRKFRFSKAARRFSAGENTFALFRIIGNSLPPRHEPMQVVDNLAFQLENEANFEGCTKYWIVNRIFDAEARSQVIALLEKHNQNYFEIPFIAEDYAAISTEDDEQHVSHLFEKAKYDVNDDDYAGVVERAELAKIRRKRLYIMNNNGARNAAIEHGRARAKWILPWDGNCFLTPLGWQRIVREVARSSHVPFHIIPMSRVTDNAALRQENAPPVAKEEPQIIFHRLSSDMFDENIPYGRRPKIEFLDRLGMRGAWRFWTNDPWDVGLNNETDMKQAYKVSTGWVYRLSSGKPQLEAGAASDKRRMMSRNQAIIAAVALVDQAVTRLDLRSIVRPE